MQITALEAQLSKISYAEELRAVIYCDLWSEMTGVCSMLNLILIEPFSTAKNQDYYFFDYRLKNKSKMIISVRSNFKIK